MNEGRVNKECIYPAWVHPVVMLFVFLVLFFHKAIN